MGDIETIMCINYIRQGVAAGKDVLQLLATAASESSRPWLQDHFMQPVLENDALLLYDWGEADTDMCVR